MASKQAQPSTSSDNTSATNIDESMAQFENDAWEPYRPFDILRFDQIRSEYTAKHLIVTVPSLKDALFIHHAPHVIDIEIVELYTGDLFRLKCPHPYLIHIWRVQVEGKFWTECGCTVEEKQVGSYLNQILDGFITELVTHKGSGDQMLVSWRSDVLHPLLIRTYNLIHEISILEDPGRILHCKNGLKKRKGNQKKSKKGTVTQKDIQNFYAVDIIGEAFSSGECVALLSCASQVIMKIHNQGGDDGLKHFPV